MWITQQHPYLYKESSWVCIRSGDPSGKSISIQRCKKVLFNSLSSLLSLSLSFLSLCFSDKPTHPKFHQNSVTNTNSSPPKLPPKNWHHHPPSPQSIPIPKSNPFWPKKKKKKKNLNHHPHSPPPPPSTKKLNHLATTKTTIWHKPTITDPNSQAITKTHHQNQQASTKTLKTSKQSPKRTTKTSKHHPNTYPKWPIQTPPNDWPKLQPQPLSTQTPIYAITETHCLKSQGSWGRVMREENFEDWERLREKCREFRGKKV